MEANLRGKECNNAARKHRKIGGKVEEGMITMRKDAPYWSTMNVCAELAWVLSLLQSTLSNIAGTLNWSLPCVSYIHLLIGLKVHFK